MPDDHHILLVEDNTADVDLTLEAIRHNKIKASLSAVKDGVEALAYLRKQGKYGDARRPSLLILDLNLPRKDGREFLAELKADADLREIPVIVLTTSRQPADITAAYKSHANCYIRKPLDLEDFFAVLKAIELFWFQIVELPSTQVDQ